MNKAILTIDMPDCCDKCFALDDNSDYPMCLITHEQRGYIHLELKNSEWINVH